MTQIIFPFFPLVALAAAFMGILNACGVFFIPAFASALFNISSVATGIGFTLLFTYTGWEQPIVGMAIGVVLGGAVQAFSQLPALRRQGYRFPPRDPSDRVWHEEPVLKRMLLMMIPGTLGLAATQVNVLINSVLATSQGPGAVSWLQYAFRLMQFPIGIFGVSLAAATLPAVSRHWVARDAGAVSRTLTKSLTQVMAINFPASCGLIFLGVPIIQLLFEYGRFGVTDTFATAHALAAYAVGLTFYSAVKVLVPTCYALGNTRIAVLSSVLSVGFTIAFNLALISQLSYVGLALGTSFAAVLNAGFLIFSIQRILKRSGGGLDLKLLLKKAGLHLMVSLLMGGVVFAAYQGMLQWWSESDLILSLNELGLGTVGRLGIAAARALRLSVLMGLAIALWMGAAHLFKLTEVTEATELFLRRVKKKVSRPKK